MALVFKTPKSALNTTSKAIQNLSSDCPPCPEVNLTTADVEYTENGEYTVTPEEGYDGLTQVDITVNIPSDVKNQDKFVTPTTSSQTITADSGYSGLGTVSVSAVTSSIDANIAANNIKSGVTILGVTGTVTEGITPTGNINITNTNSTDVTNYATAQVVDANLTAGNIKSGTTILGIQGSYDPQPDLETKSVTYTANDTYTITPTAGKDGMSSVEVTVNVSGSNCPDWSSIGWDCNDVENSLLAQDIENAAQNAADYLADRFTQWPNNSTIIPKVTLKNNCDYLFSNARIVRYFPDSFEGQPTSAKDMFNGVRLTKIPSFDMSEITNASGMFRNETYNGENRFTSVNLNLPKATNISGILRNGSSNNSYLTTATINAPLATNISELVGYQKSLTTLNLTVGVLTGVNSSIFSGCGLSSVPLIDTSLATSLGSMFAHCKNITTIPQYDLSSCTDIESMFMGCTSLVSIPQLNTSQVTNIGGIFYNCTALTTIPQLDFSKVTSVQGSFQPFGNCAALTTLGGFTNVGKAFNQFTQSYQHILNLSWSTLLTKESIMNVINNLAAPDDTAVTYATLKLSATSYALLTAEDIAIATAKNWTVTSA